MVTASLQIAWDYCIYKDDPNSFMMSIMITTGTTLVSIGLGCVIVLAEFCSPVALGVAIAGGVVVSLIEDKLRDALLK